MKLSVDTEARTLSVSDAAGTHEIALYSPRAFEILSDLWLKVGWDQKYTYTFSWLGRPIIQLPEDVLRIQELIWQLQPDVVVETGVAHGGSLILYASIFQAMGKGQVIGVDIEIRPQNRAAIEAHPLAHSITLLEGSSTDPAVVARVHDCVGADKRVLVILDSNHTREHVAGELEAYAPLVGIGSYIVATDGIMREVADTPRGQPGWCTDNPAAAAERFAAEHPSFVLETPPWPFNESALGRCPTHWPSAWLKRVR